MDPPFSARPWIWVSVLFMLFCSSFMILSNVFSFSKIFFRDSSAFALSFSAALLLSASLIRVARKEH
jgi:hypothetical protein